MAQAAILPKPQHMERSVEFSPRELKAPFFLRCAALFIDYMLLLMLPAAWLVFSKFAGDINVSPGISVTTWLFVLLAWAINFLALPLVRGQTVGKMMAGLTILSTDGTPIRLGHIVIRNVLGYLLTLLTLGLGFLIAAINISGRSLHDYLAGTIVVYGRKKLT